MIVYLEGADGSGKTTLNQELTTRLNTLNSVYQFELIDSEAESRISTRPLKDKPRVLKQTLIDTLTTWAKDPNKVYILDRGPLSDIIYRTFDEHQPILNLAEFIQLYSTLVDNVVLIYCKTEDSEELMLERGDDNPVALKQHHEIKYLYDQVLSVFPHIKYDFTKSKHIPALVTALLIDIKNRGTKHE